MRKRVGGIVAALGLVLGVQVAAAPAAEAATWSTTRYYGSSNQIAVTAKVGYTSGTSDYVYWMQLCIAAQAGYLNDPRLYDVDFVVTNDPTNVTVWSASNMNSGTGTCIYKTVSRGVGDAEVSFYYNVNRRYSTDIVGAQISVDL